MVEFGLSPLGAQLLAVSEEIRERCGEDTAGYWDYSDKCVRIHGVNLDRTA